MRRPVEAAGFFQSSLDSRQGSGLEANYDLAGFLLPDWSCERRALDFKRDYFSSEIEARSYTTSRDALDVQLSLNSQNFLFLSSPPHLIPTHLPDPAAVPATPLFATDPSPPTRQPRLRNHLLRQPLYLPNSPSRPRLTSRPHQL